MSRRSRLLGIPLLFVGLMMAQCSPVTESPTGPGGIGGDDRTYTNTAWGFSIDPGQTWAIQVAQLVNSPQPNGLSSVSVRIYDSRLGSGFAPTILLEPIASPEPLTLDSLATLWDELYDDRFGNYNPGSRRSVTVAGHQGIEWNFTTRTVQAQNEFFGSNRFLSILVVRDDQIYSILSGGQMDEFPTDEFRKIINTLTFMN